MPHPHHISHPPYIATSKPHCHIHTTLSHPHRIVTSTLQCPFRPLRPLPPLPLWTSPSATAVTSRTFSTHLPFSTNSSPFSSSFFPKSPPPTSRLVHEDVACLWVLVGPCRCVHGSFQECERLAECIHDCCVPSEAFVMFVTPLY